LDVYRIPPISRIHRRKGQHRVGEQLGDRVHDFAAQVVLHPFLEHEHADVVAGPAATGQRLVI
jgi:hypothetical protein